MIYFVRHTESTANRDGKFAGRTDSPLTLIGLEQAVALADELAVHGIQPARIICSTLSRTKQTARIIASRLRYPQGAIIVDPDFDEYDFGELNGKVKKGVDASVFEATLSREDPLDFYARLQRGWNRYAALPGDSLLVSHAFVRFGLECALEDGDITVFHERASRTSLPDSIYEYPNQLIGRAD